MEPLADRFRFHDAIPAQNVLPLQQRAKRDMHIVETVSRLFQISAAFKVQIARLSHAC